MAKYGKKSESKLVEVMRKFKEDQLANSKNSKQVTNQEQAIAIELPQARKAGAKVPKKTKQ